MDKKDAKILIYLIMIIFAIILAINYIKNQEKITKDTLICIGNRSTLIVSNTCGHCARQKQMIKEILPDYENYFNLISVDKNPDIWKEYNLKGVPTWIINNKQYAGVQSLKYLKELTNC